MAKPDKKLPRSKDSSPTLVYAENAYTNLKRKKDGDQVSRPLRITANSSPTGARKRLKTTKLWLKRKPL
jgi:hypothetical protein